jgi:hypothetical protein
VTVDISKLRELLQYATRLPWTVHRGGHGLAAAGPDGKPDERGMIVGMFPAIASCYRTSDADFVAAVVNALPELLEAYEEVGRLRVDLSEATRQLALNRALTDGQGQAP